MSKASKLLLCSLIIALILMNAATPYRTHAASDIKLKVQAAADQAVADGLVGISAAVYTPDEGMILVTAGVSDKKTKAAITANDVARIASASKVFVGTAVMQLIQDGKVALSDPITKYLSAENVQHLTNANKITVEELLTHSSGLYDYYSGDFGADQPTKMDFTLDEALQYAWDQPAEFQPGSQYGYSNTNTLILGEIIEKVTGQSFAKVLRDKIFTPLDLKNIYTEVFEPVPVKIARGYAYTSGDVAEIGDKMQGGGLPDGAIVASPEAMVKFMRALLVDGKLLNASTLKAMLTSHMDAEGDGMGYQIFIKNTDSGPAYYHDGAIDGYESLMIHYAESGITFAAWTNTSNDGNSAWEDFLSAVEKLIYEKSLK